MTEMSKDAPVGYDPIGYEKRERAGSGSIEPVSAQSDARAGLDLLIQICCDFCSSDPAAQHLYKAEIRR
jgi:hypothetical protein